MLKCVCKMEDNLQCCFSRAIYLYVEVGSLTGLELDKWARLADQ